MNLHHPLADSISQIPAIHQLNPLLCLPTKDEQPEWETVATWLTNGRLPHIIERTTQKNRSSSRQAQHALWFGGYVYNLLQLPIVLYLSNGRVPHLSADEIAIRFDSEGDVAAMAWHGRRFYALADDPAAHHPDSITVDCADALRDQLRQQLVSLITPCIETIKQHSPFSKAGMWALAADYTASIFAWISRKQGNDLVGVEEARRLSSVPSPLRRRRDFILIETGPIRYYMMDRASCCLYYKIEGGHYCSGCPKRPLPERIGLYEAWLNRTLTSS